MNKNTFPVMTLDGQSVQVSYLKHVNQVPIFQDEDGNKYIDSDTIFGRVELYEYEDGSKPPEDRQSDDQGDLKYEEQQEKGNEV